MSISPEAFASVAASINRMEESMKVMVKSDEIKTVVSEAVEQATKKLSERQDRIEKEFSAMKAEFQKFMNTATPRTIPNGQDYANRAKRSRSSEPGQGDEQTNPVAVIKGFPFPMWRKRLIDISKEASKDLIPHRAKHEVKASDNTTMAKVEFESRGHARAFIEAFKNNPPSIDLGGES